VTEQF